MRALLLLAALALPAATAADPALQATGRLAVAVNSTRNTCTAVLVATGRALSAGHCTGPFANHRQKLFTGWRSDGSYGAALPVAGIEKVERTPLLPANIAGIVVLDVAPRAAAPEPLPLAPAPETGDAVRVVSYPNGADAQPRDVRCTVTDRADAVLTLDCPATSGMSGAPVLVETRDGWAVAAILTARIGGSGSVALLVDAALIGN